MPCAGRSRPACPRNHATWMSVTMNSTPHFHRSGGRPYLRGIVFLLLFLATAAATYYLEKRVLCEEATFAATAVVSWSATNSGQTPADPQRSAFCLDAVGVEEGIRSVSA